MPYDAKSKKRIVVQLDGALRDAVQQLAGELEAREDVFDKMSDAEVGRRLIAWAVVEHRQGRGPWPKR